MKGCQALGWHKARGVLGRDASEAPVDVPGSLLLTTGLWKWASRSRPVALAIPWLIFPLLPVLNAQILGNGNFAHSRYLSLSSVGFAMLVGTALQKIKLGRPLLGIIRSSQIWVCLALAMLMGFAIHKELKLNPGHPAAGNFKGR